TRSVCAATHTETKGMQPPVLARLESPAQASEGYLICAVQQRSTAIQPSLSECVGVHSCPPTPGQGLVDETRRVQDEEARSSILAVVAEALRSASSRSMAASALSSNRPPYLVSVNATLLCPAHSETSRTLQPAATMIATKLCRSPWKVMSSNSARSTAGRKTVRPQARKSGPPAGAVNTRATEVGSTNSDRCRSSRRITERATGTERFDRVVLGSLSKVTWPRNSTAVEVMRMRERTGSMSRLRNPAASPHRSPAYAPTSTRAR
ncbi:MAG: hypothetical protein K0R13_2436, partial [Propionibacteriaceae bacterium]|nr:hypothetical protein [Propionibacteriaceae bacterium]